MRWLPPLLLAAALVAGCGEGGDRSTPAACLGGAADYLHALEDAPEPVRLDGSTAISDCLVPGQPPATLATVGESAVAAATRLNARARRDPTGDATIQLGYLVGAVQEGASTTGGIHADLVRRLDRAARFSPGDAAFSVGFERAFGEGYAAGQENG